MLAWHPEVAMTQEEIDDFLSGRWVVRLATLARDGYPHVTPLWYYWDGQCLYLALDPESTRLQTPQPRPALLGCYRYG